MALQLQIEPTNVCQASCCFCPYRAMRRPKGTMDLALYRRMIDEAASSPAIERITLTGLGEPLLDRHLVERVRYARAQMPKGILIDLYTNGALLTPAIVDRLIAAGLTCLNVSVNAVNGDKRRAIMGLDDYDVVVEGIRHALRVGKDQLQVLVKAIATKDLLEVGDAEQFLDQWEGPVEQGGHAFLHLEGNWAGLVGQPMRVAPTRACPRALSQIMVLWTGEVVLCCFDAEGQVVLGDLRTQTLREIYNGQPALGIREAHVQGHRSTLPLCATCTSI